MKKIVTIVAVVVGMLAMSASAQVPSKPFSISAGGGLSLPMGDFSDGYKLGFHGTARLGFNAMPKLQALVGADYHMFPMEGLYDVPGVDGGDVMAMLFAADLKLNLGIPMTGMNPYAFGGLGLAYVNQDEVTVAGVTVPLDQFGGFDTETKFFVEFGGGLEMGLFFIQGKFVSVFMPDEKWNFIPITAGVKF